MRQGAGSRIGVRTPSVPALTSALAVAGAAVAPGPDDLLCITGLTAGQIGDLALAHGIALHELAPRPASLEEAFMELTADSVEYLAGGRS